MKFIFLRHGKTLYNEQKITQGWCDSPLSEEGINKLNNTKKYLKKIHIDFIYCSPSGRAKETLNTVLPHHGQTCYDERLKEINFGIFEELAESLRLYFNIESKNWMYDFDMDYTTYGGECLTDVIQRMKEVIDECIVKYPDKTILICSHGCSIIGLVNKLCKEDIPPISNGGVIELEYDGCFHLNNVFEP